MEIQIPKFDINDELQKKYHLRFNSSIIQTFSEEPFNNILPKKIDFKDKKTKLSFENVLGFHSYKKVDNKYSQNALLRNVVSELPFFIENSVESEKSENIIQMLANTFENQEVNIENISKLFMINGRTVPIKINYNLVENHESRQLFIKKPKFERLVGIVLYNIISGMESIRYAFNDHIFVEEGIKASPINDHTEKRYFHSEEYFIGIGRASVHADFLKLGRDCCSKKNRLVDKNRQTILFDFDTSYSFSITDYCDLFDKYYKLTSEITKNNPNFKKQILDGEYDEKQKVAERLKNNSELVSKVTDAFAKQKIDNMGEEINTFDDLFLINTGFTFKQYIDYKINRYEYS